MINHIKMRYYQVTELINTNGYASVFKKIIPINNEIVVVEKDLNKINTSKILIKNQEIKLIRITKNITQNNNIIVPLKSRQLKTDINLSKGYKGYAFLKNDTIIADIWYIDNDKLNWVPMHPDLKILNISINNNEAYLFDAYIYPIERGSGMVNTFITTVLYELKNNNYKKVYGYYDKSNIPAMWMHKSLGYNEIQGKKLYWYSNLFKFVH